MKTLRDQFLLNSDVHFLNHGSFGATPRPVFEAYQAWQLRLERQPVQFFMRDLFDQLNLAQTALADYLGTTAGNIVYIPNATHGANVVARSIQLESGDEILTSNHEYGACLNAWEYSAGKAGATVVRQEISLPAGTVAEMVDEFWAGVTPRTRVIFLSHITSPTALILPVAEICQRARAAGILTAIDGAHAPGQLPLDLDAMGADFYFGNAHKWLCAPKGAAFLYAAPCVQDLVQPLVVGWGWGPNGDNDFGSPFLNGQQYLGTNDLSSYLSVPDAIAFQQNHDWPARQGVCHELVGQTMRYLADRYDQPLAYADDSWYAQMAVAPLPPGIEPKKLHAALLANHRVEIPIGNWNGQNYTRISVQVYNSQEDLDALVAGLEAEIGAG